LEAIQNPDHPEHESMLEWVGGSFDPEAFDVDEVNQQLKHIRYLEWVDTQLGYLWLGHWNLKEFIEFQGQSLLLTAPSGIVV
jgi:Plasmid pRiA4b ORF-3-like protein